MRLDDTIVAIATPLITSGLGVIRVSGTKAILFVDKIFNGKALKTIESNKLVYGWILDKDKLLDKVLVVVMRAPKSYTTEDVVEIHCHGSPFVLRKILDLILKQGARLADAGEFTQRAFINERIDLTEAEAIFDLIHANSEISAKLAADQMNGKLYRAIDSLRNQVSSIASMVEASIEFPEEVNEFNLRKSFLQKLDQASEDLKKLLINAELSEKIRSGFSVTLIGRPNVGKSSLFNILLREQRVIVTDIPGTTRDSIEELVQIKGVTFRLIDTAGVRKTKDPIESEGIRRTFDARKKADFELLILDASEELNEDDHFLINKVEKNNTLIVINKKDLIGSKLPLWHESIKNFEYVLISAKSGDGCEKIDSILHQKAILEGVNKHDEIWITNKRQLESAKNALKSLKTARKVINESYGEEYLAVDLRSCLNSLGEIVGETTPDDLLAKIFSEFCIGK